MDLFCIKVALTLGSDRLFKFVIELRGHMFFNPRQYMGWFMFYRPELLYRSFNFTFINIASNGLSILPFIDEILPFPTTF
ncbi:Uncharacterised protein [Vibrio cholerae]|nr:Uncharacterised protein [Vibrio cholerae]